MKLLTFLILLTGCGKLNIKTTITQQANFFQSCRDLSNYSRRIIFKIVFQRNVGFCELQGIDKVINVYFEPLVEGKLQYLGQFIQVYKDKYK